MDAHSIDTWRLFSQGKKEQHLPTWEKNYNKQQKTNKKIWTNSYYLSGKETVQVASPEHRALQSCGVPEAPCLHSLIQSCISHSGVHRTAPLAPDVHPLHKPAQCFLMAPVLGNAPFEDVFPVYTVIPLSFLSFILHAHPYYLLCNSWIYWAALTRWMLCSL